IYVLQNRLDLAIPVFQQLYELTDKAQIKPEDSAFYASSYGVALAKSGQHEQALGPLTVAHQRWLKASPGHSIHRRVLETLVFSCNATGRSDQASQWGAELSKYSAATAPASAPTPPASASSTAPSP